MMDLRQDTVLFRTDRPVFDHGASPWRKVLTWILLCFFVVFLACLSGLSLLFAAAGIWFLLPFLPALPDWINVDNSFKAIFAAGFGVAVFSVVWWVIIDLTLRIETRVVIDPFIGEIRWESRCRHREDKVIRLPLARISGVSVWTRKAEGETWFTIRVNSTVQSECREIGEFDSLNSATAEADRLRAALRSAGWSGETPQHTAPETP